MRNCRNQAANPRPQEVSGAQEQSPQVMQRWQCQPGHLPATLGKAQQTRGTSTSFSFFSVSLFYKWSPLNRAEYCQNMHGLKEEAVKMAYYRLLPPGAVQVHAPTQDVWALGQSTPQQRNSDTAGKGQPNPPRYELVSAQRSPGERQ